MFTSFSQSNVWCSDKTQLVSRSSYLFEDRLVVLLQLLELLVQGFEPLLPGKRLPLQIPGNDDHSIKWWKLPGFVYQRKSNLFVTLTIAAANSSGFKAFCNFTNWLWTEWESNHYFYWSSPTRKFLELSVSLTYLLLLIWGIQSALHIHP